MKKNKFMRLASALLILTLLSTCAISGTYAKYVTTGSASETARVAKFGVKVGTSGSLFSNAYTQANDNTPGTWATSAENDTLTVVANVQSDKVVAPGTKSDTNGLGFSITGTPEVDVAVNFTLTVTSDVKVPAKNGEDAIAYLDWTTGNDDDDTFTLAADYTPVKFTLKQGDTAVVTNGTLADVKTYLENRNGTYPANTDLTQTFGSYTLTWEWAFGDPANNKADTLLGNIATGTDTSEYAAGVSTQVAFDLSITVAQVD